MVWWGKIIGAFFGYMLGGIIGAFIGLFIGHNFDRGLSAHWRGVYAGYTPGHQARTRTAFFKATFSIMGHIAKSDGRVTENEIRAANEIMQRMGLKGDARLSAIRYFEAGKQLEFDLNTELDYLVEACGHDNALLQMFLEIQLYIAQSGGTLTPSKIQLLNRIAAHIELPPIFDQHYSRSDTHQPSSLTEAYKLLGVASSATINEIKRAYRRLLSQHHPDKLIAKGLPEEMIKVANEKTHRIRSAYEQIMEHRKS